MSLRFHAEVINRKSHFFRLVKKLYHKAFPWKQRIPFSYLMFLNRKKTVDFLVLCDENQFVGFIFLVSKNQTTHITYLAIDEQLRSCGYGSKTLNLIKSIKSGNKIFLNIDRTDIQDENQVKAIKRKQFYLKNEFSDCNVWVSSTFEKSETMVYNGSLTVNEVNDVFSQYANPLFLKMFKHYAFEKQK